MISVFVLAPPPSLAVATKEEVVFVSESGEAVRRVPLAARRLEWSPDGRTLAVLATDGALWTLAPDGEPLRVAEGASEPVWTTDGRLLYTQGAKGVFTGATAVVPTAHSPAPSPDGLRLAFATDGPQGGVWTAAADGSGARRLLRGERTGGVSWTYDGRWLGAVVDGRLRLVRANGLAARDLGPVEGTTALWSGGSPDLLARRDKGWSVYGFLDDAWTDVSLDAVPEPRWVGPRRLLGVRGGTAFEVTLGGESARVSSEVAVDAARVVGTYRGASFPDRFRGAPRPSRGAVAWGGRVLSSDPIDGLLTVAVESETDARGRETAFGKAAVRRAKVPPGALSRRLAVLPDTDAWLVVASGRVIDAFIPDAPLVAEPAGRSRPARPARMVEYDGVSRDRVVVPMIYPLPAMRPPRRDSFLDARDGGNRRHHGNDLMAPKMTPLLAVFDGTVSFGRTDYPGASNSLSLRGDDGFTASYLHINNDTPGTDDGRGSLRYAFPADLQPGDRVRAGQVVAWCGDSGNAENAGSHLHFELYDGDGGAILDPFYSLQSAQRLATPRYPDPDPVLRAGPGEARWDGVATAVDRNKSVVALELTGLATPGHPPVRNLKPRVVYLAIPLGRTLRYRGGADLSYPLDAVQPGMRLSAVGTVRAGKMAVRAASMALASG